MAVSGRRPRRWPARSGTSSSVRRACALGRDARDLEPYIGQSSRVCELLNRKHPLSLRMVKRLHDGLKIPYESLMAGVE